MGFVTRVPIDKLEKGEDKIEFLVTFTFEENEMSQVAQSFLKHATGEHENLVPHLFLKSPPYVYCCPLPLKAYFLMTF